MVCRLPEESIMGFPEPVGAAPRLWLPEVREWEAFMTGEWAEESNGPEAEQLLWPEAQDTSKGFSLSSLVKPLSRQWLHHCISRGQGYSRSNTDAFRTEPVSSSSKVSRLSNNTHHPSVQTTFILHKGNRGVSFGLGAAELPPMHCLISFYPLFPFLNIRESFESLLPIGIGVTLCLIRCD